MRGSTLLNIASLCVIQQPLCIYISLLLSSCFIPSYTIPKYTEFECERLENLWCKNDYSMAAYLSMLFGISLIFCELIMAIAIFITIVVKDGKRVILIIFMILATGLPLLYSHQQWGKMK